MSEPCFVLRCTAAGSIEVPTKDLIGPRKHVPVCAEHAAAIEGGTPWRWRADQDFPWEGTILMGSDIDTDGITITRCLGWEEGWGAQHPNGGNAINLRFERTGADGFSEEIRLIMNPDLLRDLANTVKLWQEPNSQP